MSASTCHILGGGVGNGLGSGPPHSDPTSPNLKRNEVGCLQLLSIACCQSRG